MSTIVQTLDELEKTSKQTEFKLIGAERFDNLATKVTKILDSYLIQDIVSLIMDYSCDLLFEMCINWYTSQNYSFLPKDFFNYLLAEKQFYSCFSANEFPKSSLECMREATYHTLQNKNLENCPFIYNSGNVNDKISYIGSLYEIKYVNPFMTMMEIESLLTLISQSTLTLRALTLNFGEDVIPDDFVLKLFDIVKQCKKLITLEWLIQVSENISVDDFKNSIANHPSLRRLVVYCNKNCDSLFYTMKQLKSLTIASLSKSDRNTILNFLSTHSDPLSLNSIVFYNEDSEENIISVLKNNTQFEICTLPKISASILNQLVVMPILRSLTISIDSNRNMDDLISILPQAAVEFLQILITSDLTIFNTSINDKKLVEFGQAMKNIKILFLTCDNKKESMKWLDGQFVKSVFPCLKKCEYLALVNGILTDKDFPTIVEFLPESVETLLMPHQKFQFCNVLQREQIEQKLTETTPKNTKLQDLQIDENDCGSELQPFLATLLKKHWNNLKSVEFESSVKVDCDFILAVLELTAQNPKLESLSISNYQRETQFTSKEIQLFKKKLAKSNTKCDIHYNLKCTQQGKSQDTFKMLMQDKIDINENNKK
jgi:hypothetical protein